MSASSRNSDLPTKTIKMVEATRTEAEHILILSEDVTLTKHPRCKTYLTDRTRSHFE